jgi:hypothetical protein
MRSIQRGSFFNLSLSLNISFFIASKKLFKKAFYPEGDAFFIMLRMIRKACSKRSFFRSFL